MSRGRPSKRRILGWTALGLVGAGAIGAGAIIHQNLTPPVANSHYVALGSSYAAGFGLGPRVPGSPLVSMRTVNGYPQLLARLLAVPSFTDMTSSGSTVRQVLRGGQMLLGPQIDALGPETRLVTLTAGGNDVGYVGDLSVMAARSAGGFRGIVADLVKADPKPLAQRDFEGLRALLAETFVEIRRRSPRARIVVVTYPVILPTAGSCPALGITTAQAELMHAVGDRLAETTRVATR